MTLSKVFVASSSEGLGVVEPVRKLLQQTLNGVADVAPWPGQFQLTRTYIESLEGLLDTSDLRSWSSPRMTVPGVGRPRNRRRATMP